MNLENKHPPQSGDSSISDFDFFIGSWTVFHRRLKKRLVNSQEWDSFSGTTITQKILGGIGNFDDNVLDLPDGIYRAATIRTFNIKTKLWSIWWLDGRQPDQFDTPMRGQFQNGTGLFYADDMLDGQAIKVRFLWTLPTSTTPRWEQAFSLDEGVTWETNWVMDFSRAN